MQDLTDVKIFLASLLRPIVYEAVKDSLATFPPPSPPPAEETPISTAEAARQFGIAKQTLYQNARRLNPSKRFGRLYFYPSELRKFLAEGQTLSQS